MKYVFSWKYEKSVMPDELLEISYDFDRDIKKLWALELPIEKIAITGLEWHLDMPFFWQKDKPFSLKPRDVIKNPEKYSFWIKRISEVDTSYPIDILFWKGRWQILDGLHRLCKQYSKGETEISVRKLPITLVQKIYPDQS